MVFPFNPPKRVALKDKVDTHAPLNVWVFEAPGPSCTASTHKTSRWSGTPPSEGTTQVVALLSPAQGGNQTHRPAKSWETKRLQTKSIRKTSTAKIAEAFFGLVTSSHRPRPCRGELLARGSGNPVGVLFFFFSGCCFGSKDGHQKEQLSCWGF